MQAVESRETHYSAHTWVALRARLSGLLACGGTCEAVGFGIAGARDVGYGEVERTRQFSAGPIQGIEAGIAAGVFASHLLDDYFRIREYVQRFGAHFNGILQRLQKSCIFSDIIILMADPFPDLNFSVFGAFDHYPNTGRAWIPQRTAIDVSYETGHSVIDALTTTMPDAVSTSQEMELVPLQTLAIIPSCFAQNFHRKD